MTWNLKRWAKKIFQKKSKNNSMIPNHILIYDDDEKRARISGFWLYRKGYSVQLTTDALKAISLLNSGKVGFFVSNLDFVKEHWIEKAQDPIQQKYMTVPFLIVTAGRETEAVEQFGKDHVLSLPFHPEELEIKISQLAGIHADKKEIIDHIASIKTKKPHPTLDAVFSHSSSGWKCSQHLLEEAQIRQERINHLLHLQKIDPNPGKMERCEIHSGIWHDETDEDGIRVYRKYCWATKDDGTRLFQSNPKNQGKPFEQVWNYLIQNGWRVEQIDEFGREKYFSRRVNDSTR